MVALTPSTPFVYADELSGETALAVVTPPNVYVGLTVTLIEVAGGHGALQALTVVSATASISKRTQNFVSIFHLLCLD
jgi:hypothetical protein